MALKNWEEGSNFKVQILLLEEQREASVTEGREIRRKITFFLIMCQDKEGKYSKSSKHKTTPACLDLIGHLVLLRMGSALTHRYPAVT